MERNWKKTLAAALLAVAVAAALVLIGGGLPKNTTAQDTPGEQTQQRDDTQSGSAASPAADPNDPAVVGGDVGSETTVTGGGSTGEQDRYHTDPVPEGKPAPVEPEDTEVDSAVSYTCTFSISCETILDNWELCSESKKPLVPADGVILPVTTVTFSEGESVYDVLQRVCRDNKIHMESSWTPMYNSAYIEGIHNLYEFDVGQGSGWMYSVNGWYPNYGCSRYALQDGDVVAWRYTCDYGADVGGGFTG